MAFLDRIQDLIITYQTCVVTITGAHLHQTLHKRRSQLAQAFAQDDDIDHLLDDLQGRKMFVRDQTVKDVSAVHTPNVLFNQMEQLSMTNRINETHLRSIKNLTHFVTVGENPFFQFNLPYNYQHQDINELAENVVSTVKTGLFRAAKGLIWGSSSGATAEGGDEKRQDPEQKLAIAHAFKDIQKSGVAVERSHDNRYLAIKDNQNRVLVVESATGAVVNIWKGYHHPQIGWIVAQDEDHDDHEEAHLACLLVIFLPRNGSLEVFSVERKTRVAGFSVSRTGRLVQASSAILDPQCKVEQKLEIDTCFIDAQGKIMKISVPLRTAVVQSSAHLDLAKQSALFDILNDDSKKENETETIIELISGAKSVSSKITMILDLMKSAKMNNSQIEAILKSLEEFELSLENPRDQLLKCLIYAKRIVAAAEFFLDKQKKTSSQEFNFERFIEKEFGQELWLKNITRLQKKTKVGSNQEGEMSVSLLSSWLDLNLFCFDKDTDQVPLKALKKGDDQIVLTCLIESSDDPEALQEHLSHMMVSGENLFKFLLKSFMCLNVSQASERLDKLQDLLKIVLGMPMHSQDMKLIRSTNMTYQLLVFTKSWAAIKGSSAQRFFHLIKSFLRVKVDFQHFLQDHDIESLDLEKSHFTFDTVFSNGNGKVVEVVSEWLVQAQVKLDDWKSGKLRDFLANASQVFPKNSQDQTLLSHITWEYLHHWNKQRHAIASLDEGAKFLSFMINDSSFDPVFNHKLALLAWKTFLNMAVLDAVNVTETRSPSRCYREIGVQINDLVPILEASLEVAGLILKTDPGVQKLEMKASDDYYDDISFTRQSHLLDHVFHGQADQTSSEQMSLRYQFVLTTCLILRFDLKIKPLSLFSYQEANSFFQGCSESPSNISLLGFTHNQMVKGERKKFLAKVCSQVVHCISHVSPDKLDTEEFSKWQPRLAMLEKMWFLDQVKSTLIVSLFKEGFDGLGQDLLAGVSKERREAIGMELVKVSMLRLTKFIYESDDHSKKLVMVKQSLLSQLSQMQGEAMELPEVGIQDTKSLLVTLTSMHFDDETMQMVYELLSLVQLYMRA